MRDSEVITVCSRPDTEKGMCMSETILADEGGVTVQAAGVKDADEYPTSINPALRSV
jgi:hypothetical protein